MHDFPNQALTRTVRHVGRCLRTRLALEGERRPAPGPAPVRTASRAP